MTTTTSPEAAPPPALGSAVRKIFRRIVPLFTIMLIANQIDRGNIAFAERQLEADLGIGVAAYGLGAGLFFVAYAIFEVPSNMMLEKFGPKIWLTRIMITWGLVSAGMAFVQGTTSFYVLRFLLGIAEAGFFPAIIYYFSRWLPSGHRARASAIFISGSSIATIIAGPLSGALLQLDGFLGMTGWQSMFLIEGLLSVVIGFIAWRLMDHSIDDATWLTADEKRALATTIDAEQAEREQRRETGGAVSRWKLLLDPKILVFCWIFFAIALSIYAATFWLPKIVGRIGGLNDFEIGLLSAVPWVFAIGAMYVSGRLSDRSGRRKPWLVASLLTAALGTGLATFGSPWFALAALCVGAMGFKSASPLFWSIPQHYLDARISAPAIALINSLGNLGGFVAPTVFGLLEATTGSTEMGLWGLTACSVLAAVSVLLLRDGGEPRKHPAPTGATPAPATS
ncbi:MFS transporter [Streptomyces sp. LHD-70]|uniref:MFS transporter n=1 Tax=Streptomyces sp. LHD-70 TaxID=3072140 RepID=UPI00280E092F|nr:MFS transporter [Streptomyces sp. LHD-70]MDQ8708052.1 MFS transporter [Streptomyces sp. LHD-70]